MPAPPKLGSWNMLSLQVCTIVNLHACKDVEGKMQQLPIDPGNLLFKKNNQV